MALHGNSTLRLGLLGHGAIATEHARALTRIGCSLKVVAGVEAAQAQAFAQAHGFERSTSRVDDVFESEDVDAVVVATPNAFHAEQTIAALRAGKHVLCEVPLALSASGAEHVAEAAAHHNLVAMVCHTQRFWGPVARLRERVEADRLHIHHLVHLTALLRRENVGWTGVRRNWVDSVLWHHGSHAVDTALWLLNDAPAVVTATAGHRHPETGLPLDIDIAIRMGSGSLASLVLSYNSMQSISEFIAIAEEDAFRLTGGTLAGSRESVTFGDTAAMQSAAVAAQDDLFVRAIVDGASAWPTPLSLLPVYHALQDAADQINDRNPLG
jgi:2-hydroxy-4-carboxymuconate semialdehyde hemiacetal dehydrogenase